MTPDGRALAGLLRAVGAPPGPYACRAALLAAGGLGLAAPGQARSPGWYPIIKKAWTATFDIYAAGLSAVLLALFYLVVDVWRMRQDLLLPGHRPRELDHHLHGDADGSTSGRRANLELPRLAPPGRRRRPAGPHRRDDRGRGTGPSTSSIRRTSSCAGPSRAGRSGYSAGPEIPGSTRG
ncbi:MAG: hypothetical protein MZW92_75800 [Comamonadaceae bacterium]|nr:hypothetical protein [Comamonadaceae bacterium]